MRIIGGALGGRRFRGPPPGATRPTADRVREAVASALEARGALAGARVLELYAGTGALAFEALSRGALRATCVERDRRVAAALLRCAGELGLAARVDGVVAALGPRLPAALESRLVRAAGAEGFDLVFADPPYADVDDVPPLLLRLASLRVLSDDALVVLEHATKQPPVESPFLATQAAYRYGDTTVLFARVIVDAEARTP
jgi:16S rRNA (guanine966-N2)-methyltransferase